MDIQTKIICTYEIYNNGTFVRKKQTEDDKYTPEIILNKEKFHNGDLGNEFIEFTEHMKVEIMLLSEDQNATIEVESYNSEDINVLKPGEKIVLSPGEDKDNMLVPGYYSIKIRTYNMVYDGLYKVIPSSITWEGLLNIRKYLEKIVKGLSYNIYAERNGYTGGKTIEHEIFIFEMYKYIGSKWKDLLTSIEAIINNPIMDAYKKYEKKMYTKKPDSKSQRWLVKQGQTYNINCGKVNTYFEKHSKVTFHNTENKIIKIILEDIYEILFKLNNIYLNMFNEFLDKINELEYKSNELQYYYDLNRVVANTQKAKTDIMSELKSISRKRDECECNIKVIKEYINNINKMKNLISHYKNETLFKEIELNNCIFKPTMRLLKDKYYSNIYEVYRNLNNMKYEGKDRNVFPHKKTSKLFEIYSYILIKEILEDLGFKWVAGWLKEVNNILSYNGDLLPNETIILIKDEYKIELIYDKEFQVSSNIRDSSESQLVSIKPKSSRRPDITLMLYKNEKFVRGFIAEIKCRKKQYIYNKSVHTDVMYQLMDYTSLKYYSGEEKKMLMLDNCITKVVVIYPKQSGECKFKDSLYGFTFVQVEPTSLEEKPYGYKELKDEIEDFIYNN